jgi:hypothetical protein
VIVDRSPGTPLEQRQAFWRELALVALGFSVLAVVFLAPLALHLGSVGRVDNADTRLIIWNVAWVARTMVIDPLHLFDANIFYPHTGTLAYSEPNIGAGILALPMYWATGNPYAAHNFVVVLTFVLSAVAMYYLVRYLTVDRRAAVIAAICFAYCPYVIARLPHVHLLMTAGLPLAMLALHRLTERPTLRRGTVLGLVVAGEALACGYYAVFVALTVGFSALIIAARRELMDRRYWSAILVAGLVTIALTVPLFVPYMRLQQAGFSRSLDEARQWSADWRAYLASSAFAHAWMLPLIGHWKDVLFPGYSAVLFGIAGFFVPWRPGTRQRDASVVYGSIALVAWWASLGPDAGLYRALYTIVPGFGLLRAASRFGIVVAFALTVLAGMAISALFARLDSRPRVAALAAAALAAAVVGELWVGLTFAPVPPVEPVYRALAALPRGPVLEIPFYSTRFAFERTRYMLSSTSHWMPLVNGYSSYTPADLVAKTETLGAFPTAEAFKVLERDRVRYVVFHFDLLSAEMKDDLASRLHRFESNLRRLYADDRTSLYEIVSFSVAANDASPR